MGESLTTTVAGIISDSSNLNLQKQGSTITAHEGEGSARGSWVDYVTCECITNWMVKGELKQSHVGLTATSFAHVLQDFSFPPVALDEDEVAEIYNRVYIAELHRKWHYDS